MSAAPPKNSTLRMTPPMQHARHICTKCQTKCPTCAKPEGEYWWTSWLNAPDALCSAEGVIVVLVIGSSRILISLLLSRKRCALHARGGDASLRLPLAKNVHKYHSFFRCHLAGNPRLCMMGSSARRPLPSCYETHLQGLGTMGQGRSTYPPRLVVLITTRSRSVFRSMYTDRKSVV